PAPTLCYSLSLHDALPIYLFKDEFELCLVHYRSLWFTSSRLPGSTHDCQRHGGKKNSEYRQRQRFRPHHGQPSVAQHYIQECLRSEEHTSELQSRENLVCH